MIVLPILCLFCFIGCGGDKISNASAAKKYNIVLSDTEIVLEVGQTKELNASYGEGFTLVYTSSDESVATVSQTGLIEAKKTGTAYVDVAVDGKTKTCKVSVVENEYKVELDCTEAKVVVGAKLVLKAKVFKNGEEISRNVTWDFEVAESCWSKEGNTAVFTSQSAGAYKVTATYGGASCECNITVVATIG